VKILEIDGNVPLTGTIRIGGAKNSAVALMPATILSNNKTTLTNVPDITDIYVLKEILEFLGVKVSDASSSMVIDPSSMKNKVIPDKLSNKLRASYYFMASLLAKYKHVKMHFPGGCQIGSRPIDQTLKVFKALGAEIKEKDCVFDISARKLVGNEITLDMPSVGATVNGIIVAALAEGETVIHNAAREPEIVDLADMLNKMGAKITGAGNSTVKIVGVEELDGCFHNVIPDRIEAGTYIILGALVGTYLRIENIIPEHIKTLLDKMQDMGCDLEINQDSVVVNANDNLLAIDIKTSGYPGFPTDLQQPFVTLLAGAKGKSEVVENIYENRFMNIPYLNKMGANISIKERTLTILGSNKLHGEEVEATDLRAGASLLLAALKADGHTTIKNVEYILRGYEELIEKLVNVGAKIELKEI
jgi:UDP-N-acetylglucosamine 1-carboxyvinyltransferase